MLKEYFSIAEILELKLEGYLSKWFVLDKAEKESWLFRPYKTTKKDGREYHISNFPAPVREKIVNKLLERATFEARLNGKNIEFVQESLRVAYSRLEIILFIRVSKLSISKFCAIYNGREFFNNEISAVTYENIPRGTTRLAISMPNTKGEKALADVLDKPLYFLFPKRYKEDNKRLRPQPTHKYWIHCEDDYLRCDLSSFPDEEITRLSAKFHWNIENIG